MTVICYILIAIMTFLGSVASLYLKKASGSGSIIELLKNTSLYVGAILYVTSALINIYVLNFLDYSIVLPLTAFTYVWTMLIAHLVLKEKISRQKLVGLCLVVLGAFSISVRI